MVINYVNPEHTHALIDLPTAYSVEDVTKLPKELHHRIGLTRTGSSAVASDGDAPLGG